MSNSTKKPPGKWCRVLIVATFIACCLFVFSGMILWYFISPMQKAAGKFDIESLRPNPRPALATSQPTVPPDVSSSETEIGTGKSALLPHLPDHLVDGVLANEDSRFLEHGGVDYGAILRAGFANAKAGGVAQGGSTITQQLARNAYDLGEKSFRRKITEAILAKRIEKELTKAEILEAYLNQVYFGDKLHGIDAAAHSYFGHGSEELSLAESASLIAMLKAPNKLSPRRHPKANAAAREEVLMNMRNVGSISQEEFEAAVGETIEALPATGL